MYALLHTGVYAATLFQHLQHSPKQCAGMSSTKIKEFGGV